MIANRLWSRGIPITVCVIILLFLYKLIANILRHPAFAGQPAFAYPPLLLYIGSLLLCFVAAKKNLFADVSPLRLCGMGVVLFVFWTLLFHFCFSRLELHRKLESHLGLSSFLFASLSLVLCHLVEKRAGRIVEFLLFQLALTTILLEIVIFIWVQFSQSPLAMDSQNVHQNLYRFRPKPGDRLFGYPLNSMGFYDEEFSRKQNGTFVVNSISDSFGLGVVPYPENFLTVAERKVRTELSSPTFHINNFSAPAIGMPEYLELYKTEATLFPADRIMLCIFVGNDIENLKKDSVESVWNFSHWHLYKITQKLLALRRARSTERNVFSIGRTKPAVETQAFTLESPSFSEERFLEIELDRLTKVSEKNPTTEETYRRFFIWLKYFLKTVKEPLLLVLIPDEFQVNDDLYDTLVRGSDSEKFERFLPQQKILEFCRSERIECLNLLPELREGEKTGHCYHLRDTHWNAKGNRIAGEAIGEEILALWSAHILSTQPN